MSADRRRAVTVAGHTGDLETVTGALDDVDPAVRAAALGALHRLGALDGSHLVDAIGDPSPTVRRRATQLSANRPGDAAPALVPLLADDDHGVAEVAAWALGERQPPEPGSAVALAVAARTHEDALVREAAVAALGALGDPDGLDAVLAALDERATIRRRAVIALAAFDGPAVDAALQRCLDDRDRQVRQTAEDLLA